MATFLSLRSWQIRVGWAATRVLESCSLTCILIITCILVFRIHSLLASKQNYRFTFMDLLTKTMGEPGWLPLWKFHRILMVLMFFWSLKGRMIYLNIPLVSLPHVEDLTLWKSKYAKSRANNCICGFYRVNIVT